MIDGSPEIARHRGSALDVDVFTKMEGGGSRQPYPTVTVAHGGLPKASGGNGS
jgi:hypothetical protein